MEKIGYWEYMPELEEPWHDLSSFLEYEAYGDKIKDSILAFFFEHPEIKELVKDNNWMPIFHRWSRENKGQWTCKMLYEFLYYSGIDFWNYIPPDFDLLDYGLQYYLKKA